MAVIIRMLDEAVALGERGVLLFAENQDAALVPGSQLMDARGQVHWVSSVAFQEEWLAVYMENGDAAYFERLFRDVRVDATAFELLG